VAGRATSLSADIDHHRLCLQSCRQICATQCVVQNEDLQPLMSPSVFHRSHHGSVADSHASHSGGGLTSLA
jgi:hypothetical protein